MGGSRGRGRRSPGCGRSSTTAMGRWSRGARRRCSARGWRGRGSRVVVPLRDKTMAWVVMGDRPGVAEVRWCADLAVDRQRKDGVGRSCVRDRGAQSADRVGGSALRGEHPDVCAGRPAVEGRLEATVKIAKADLCRLITTSGWSTRSSPSWRRACQQWMADVNTRPHRGHAGSAGDPAGG